MTLQRLYFAHPGDIDTPTGGYGYDRRIIAGLRDLGWHVDLVSLGDGFPAPSSGTLASGHQKLMGLPDGALVVIDGLAFGAMPEAAAAASDRLSLIALVHHPLCQENGLSEDQADALLESEARALAAARNVIVTSPATARQVSELLGVPAQKIDVILPGTDKPDPFERRPSEKVRLLSVGTVVPRKGYDLLLKALSGLADLDWHLEIVGGLQADPGCYRSLLRQAQKLGLSERVTFRGAVRPDELTGFYRQADIFVLASRYEGYGMAYTEALAHGLPVIGSGGGAVKDTLSEGAAVYCGIEDVKALQEALRCVIPDPARRLQMAEAARMAAEALPTWQNAAAQFAMALQERDE